MSRDTEERLTAQSMAGPRGGMSRRLFTRAGLGAAASILAAPVHQAIAQASRGTAMRSPTSDLRADEHLVLMTTAASPTLDGTIWIVPIHAWICRLPESRVRLRLMERVLTSITGRALDDVTRPNFRRRAGLLIADNKRHRRIVVRLAGSTFSLPPTAANGHARMEVIVGAAAAHAAASSGRLPIVAVLREGDARAIGAEALLVGDEGISVISDIDDTVKVTHVTDRKRMLAATFLDDFAAVPGMADRYRGWVGAGAALHFVSSSPWHLYEPLAEHLAASGFPPSTMTMKHVRLKDRTFADLFRPGSATKPPALRALMDQYPRRRFVLVGDSGEEDPEVYADLASRFPLRIAAIHIRNVTDATLDDTRFRPLVRQPNAPPWQLFREAHELPQTLA